MTERQYLEHLLDCTAGEVWEQVFCYLRNATNPKYGGRPDWQGNHYAAMSDWVYIYRDKFWSNFKWKKQ